MGPKYMRATGRAFRLFHASLSTPFLDRFFQYQHFYDTFVVKFKISRLIQRGANRRALLLILRPHWIIVCRAYQVYLVISIYMYEYPMKLTVFVSVSVFCIVQSSNCLG